MPRLVVSVARHWTKDDARQLSIGHLNRAGFTIVGGLEDRSRCLVRFTVGFRHVGSVAVCVHTSLAQGTH